jgi:hypothetical protein
LALTTPAFGKTVGFFAFFGLAVPLLGFAVGFTTAGITTANTTIGLSPPAGLTDTETSATPATTNDNQVQNPALKIAGV